MEGYLTDVNLLANDAEVRTTAAPDLVELNHKLLEEISAMQIKMIEVIRENVRLRTEIEDLRMQIRKGHANTSIYESTRMPKSRSNLPTFDDLLARNGSEDVARKFIRQLGSSPQEEVLLSVYMPMNKADKHELRRSMKEMESSIGELDERTKCHEPLLLEEAEYAKQVAAEVARKHPQFSSPRNNQPLPPFPSFPPEAIREENKSNGSTPRGFDEIAQASGQLVDEEDEEESPPFNPAPAPVVRNPYLARNSGKQSSDEGAGGSAGLPPSQPLSPKTIRGSKLIIPDNLQDTSDPVRLITPVVSIATWNIDNLSEATELPRV